MHVRITAYVTLVTMLLLGCNKGKPPTVVRPATGAPDGQSAQPTTPSGDAPPTAPPQHDTEEDLENLIKGILHSAAGSDVDTVTKCVSALAVPAFEDWFSKTFGSEMGKQLADEYREWHEAIQSGVLAKEFVNISREAWTDVKITRYSEGLPLPVFKVHVRQEGQQHAASSLKYFAYVQGDFRLIGKLHAYRRRHGALKD